MNWVSIQKSNCDVPGRLGHVCRVSILVLVNAFLWVGCNDEKAVPNPPNSDELRAVYAEPTGELTPDVIAETLEQLTIEGKPMSNFDEARFMPDLLKKIEDVTEESGSISIGRIRLEGEALGSLATGCDVVGTAPAGEAMLYFVVTDTGLNPNLWGTVTDCVVEIGLGDASDYRYLVYNGSFQTYLMHQDGFSPISEDWILRFEGSIRELDGTDVPYSFDFMTEGNEVTTRVPLSNGEWILVSFAVEGHHFSFQDTLGTIECNTRKRVCTTADHPIGSFGF